MRAECSRRCASPPMIGGCCEYRTLGRLRRVVSKGSQAPSRVTRTRSEAWRAFPKGGLLSGMKRVAPSTRDTSAENKPLVVWPQLRGSARRATRWPGCLARRPQALSGRCRTATSVKGRDRHGPTCRRVACSQARPIPPPCLTVPPEPPARKLTVQYGIGMDAPYARVEGLARLGGAVRDRARGLRCRGSDRDLNPIERPRPIEPPPPPPGIATAIGVPLSDPRF